MENRRFESPPVMHSASKYYDPVKAREYYMRTRQLKGRTKGMTKEQKSAWEYTRDNVRNEKKQKLESSRDAGKAQLEALRQNATRQRESVRTALEKLVEQVKLKPIPKDAPKEVRDKIKMERAAAREKIHKIAGDLRTMINQVRGNMSAEKDAIKKEYEKVESKELDNIKNTKFKPDKKEKKK